VVVSTAGNYQNQAGGALSFIRNLLRDAPLTPDGDLDGDGAADSLDLQILWQVLADNVAEGEPPCVTPGLGDLDGDGRLDLADGMILQSRFVGGR